MSFQIHKDYDDIKNGVIDMRELYKRFVMDENSEKGRPKTYTHKWECFEKLRIYEHIGSPAECDRYKKVYDRLIEVLNTDELFAALLKQQ
jgi:hypothetical protein